MDTKRLSLKAGKDLQLVIAATQDLPTTLAPHRDRRRRRKTRVAAGLGGATTVVIGGALWAANIGFWASVGAALGLGTIPLVITLAGTGKLALGIPRRKGGSRDYARQRDQLELTTCCFRMLAEADGRISEEEQVFLRSMALQFPVSDEDRRDIQQRPADEVLDRAGDFDEQIRRQVLQGTWMLAETDGVTPEEETLFEELVEKLGLQGEVLELKRQSRDLQATANDLVTSMFRSCQQILAPSLGTPRANEFLESLAQIAATPPVRRSLRNSMSSGFSAGGVGRTIDEHGEAAKLVAQAHNGALAVYCPSTAEQKEARARLLELADGTTMGRGKARDICDDVEGLFEETLAAADEDSR